MKIIDTAAKNLHQVQIKFLLGELVLGLWRLNLLVADPNRFGVLGWPDEPEILLANLPESADGLLCRKVAADRFLPGVGTYGCFVRYVPHLDVLHYVDVRGSFEEYLKKFSPKTRQNLARSVRRFLERNPGGNRCEVFLSPADMPRFHDEAVAISQKTYQTRLLGSGLPASTDFRRRMIAEAELGEARGYLLRDGEQAIAFAWCRRKGGRLIYDIIGYLPESSSLSPGTVLLYLILQDVFAEGSFEMVDFGPGEAQYKSLFATHRQEFIDTYLFRRTLRNQLLARLHFALSGLSTGLGKRLDQLGLKKRIKDAIRSIRGS